MARPDLGAQLAVEPTRLHARGFGLTQRYEIEAPSAAVLSEIGAWWTSEVATPRFLLVASFLGSEALGRSCAAEHRLPRGASPTDARPPEVPEALLTRISQDYVDAAREAGAFVRALREALPRGPRPRWLVVSSLYGLNLAEYGGTQTNQLQCADHGHLLERNLHVPLLVEGAGSSPRREEIVELLDLLPTLARAAGAPPPAQARGHDLLGAQGEASAYAEYGDMLSLRAGAFRLGVRCFNHGGSSLDPGLDEALASDARLLEGPTMTGTRCATSLHDVERDPRQTRDLMPTETVRALHQELLKARQGRAAPALPPEPDRIHGEKRIGYW